MDTAGHVLVEAHHLYARNSTSSTSAETATRPAAYKAVGIILAVCSGLFIGVSFVIKKVGLLKANEKYNEVAGEGYGYLKNAWWWLGMSTMIVGEICNFVAYAFVDAILVTPFGALSVVITTVLSAIFLKERLSFVGKVGCFQCVLGAVVIAINAPEQSAAATIQEMQAYVIAPGFLSYAGVIVLAAAFTAFWVAPRWGKKSMFVYISICSFIGGLSVVATQGLGAAIVAQISGTDTNQFKQWFLYVLLVFVIITLLTEIIYLNVRRAPTSVTHHWFIANNHQRKLSISSMLHWSRPPTTSCSRVPQSSLRPSFSEASTELSLPSRPSLWVSSSSAVVLFSYNLPNPPRTYQILPSSRVT